MCKRVLIKHLGQNTEPNQAVCDKCTFN